MVQCKYCGRIVEKVSGAGLCNDCHGPVIESIESILNPLKESIDIIVKSKNFDTKMSRISTAITLCEALQDKYWSKGITCFSPVPEKAIRIFTKERNQAIEEEVIKQFEKAKKAKTVKLKISIAKKALSFLISMMNEYKFEKKELENNIRKFLHTIEEDDPLDKLNKTEKELKKMQKSPIRMSFEVMTMGDEKVCETCRQFDGLRLDVSEAVIGVNHPPFHKGCRCLALYSVEGIKNK